MKVYRIEKNEEDGIWYNKNCEFELVDHGLNHLPMPKEDNVYKGIYRSSCPTIEDLLYWIPKDVQKRLKANGYDYSKSGNEQTIDRIDNDKGYYPDNCRFVSRRENNKNESKKRGIVCLSKEQQNEIKELYKNGYSSRKLAEKYKVSKTTIMNVIKN